MCVLVLPQHRVSHCHKMQRKKGKTSTNRLDFPFVRKGIQLSCVCVCVCWLILLGAKFLSGDFRTYFLATYSRLDLGKKMTKLGALAEVVHSPAKKRKEGYIIVNMAVFKQL